MSSGFSRSLLQQSVRASTRPRTLPSTSQFKLSSTPQPTTSSASRLASISRQFSSSRHNMAPTPKEYDYIVIGGGSGGSGAARRAAGWYGKKTAIIEAGRSGGCCVNVGCVPKKMTYSFASINEAIHAGRFYGYDFGKDAVPFDFKTFVDKRDARIKVLNGAYESNWEKEGIDLIHGTATFVSPHELEVKPNDGGESYKITAPHITIAVGGHPTKPEGIKGSQYGITSDEYFSIQYLPKKMVFVGGGYIAVELAGVMNAIGVETHLFLRGNTFLRKFDPMVQDLLTKHYEDIGVHVHRKHPGIKEVIQLKAAKDEYDPREKELKLIMEDGSEMITNELLWAIGRAPEIENLGLDKTGVKLGKTGHIVVDKYQNTNVEGIYALGDVTGQAELTPVAIAAGRTLGNRLFSGNPEFKDAALDYDRIPTVVFSHPPLGTTGLTQPEAEEKYGKENVKVYTTKFAGMYYDTFSKEEKAKQINAFKMICKGDNEEVVGLHLLGDGCDEMMQGFGVAVKMGATRKDFQDTINIHPTSSEEVTSL